MRAEDAQVYAWRLEFGETLRPLLTLAINCYKFERFIDEALEGAFEQTYRPLEIVVSDDCSPDGSWQHILDKVASRFPNAPLDRQANCQTLVLSDPPSSSSPTSQTSPNFLSLTLNRNPTNLGLARHENRLFELSHGEWIAFQSGDDVSVPNRLEEIAKVICDNHKIQCLHSAVDMIDGTGKTLLVDKSFRQTSRGRGNGLPNVLGAGAVYHRDVYMKFGPLGAKVANEDHVLPLRAGLLGDVKFLSMPLVKYRKHGENASGCFTNDVDVAIRYRLRLIYTIYQELADLHTAEWGGLAPLHVIRRYRQLLEDDMFVQWFLGYWSRDRSQRGYLLLKLFASPRWMFVFVKRFFGRIF